MLLLVCLSLPSLAGCTREAPSLPECRAFSLEVLRVSPNARTRPGVLPEADLLTHECLVTPCPRLALGRRELAGCVRAQLLRTGTVPGSVERCCAALVRSPDLLEAQRRGPERPGPERPGPERR